MPPVESVDLVVYTLKGGFFILNYYCTATAFSEHSTWEINAHLLRSDKYRTAVSKLAVHRDAGTRQDLQKELAGYKEAFRVRRSIENTLQQHIDRILRFSVGIDHLSTVLAGIAQGKARLLEVEMKKLIRHTRVGSGEFAGVNRPVAEHDL